MKRSIHFRWKLNPSGTRDSLDEQEIAHREDVKQWTQDRQEVFGATQLGTRIALRYLLPIFVAALAVVLFSVSTSLLGGPGEKVVEAVRAPAVKIDESVVSSLNALQVARAFLDAQSEEERLKWTRNPERAKALLGSFPEEIQGYPIAHQSLQRMGVASASGNLFFERFAVTMPDGGRRLICVAKTPEGPLVDYEAFARYGTADWKSLLAGESGEEIRLVAKPSFYFQHRFADENRSLVGYAPKGTVTEDLLREITSKAPKQRVTLRLSPLADSHEQKQVVIEKVLASGWVRTDGDVEARWQLRQSRHERSALR
jgi:hypothetical protein